MKVISITRSITKKVPTLPGCTHRNAEVDDYYRTVHCLDCGATIDPFNFILAWANEQVYYEMVVNSLKREIEKLSKEKEALKTSVAYLKRKTK